MNSPDCLRTGRALRLPRARTGGRGKKFVAEELHLPPMTRRGGTRTKNGPVLAGHGAEAVRDALAATITDLPAPLRQSLTLDQGAEKAQHAQLRIDTGLEIYFADPHSPWQRGTKGTANGLLRQYFPKGRPEPAQA